jgi:hypothetical protein
MSDEVIEAMECLKSWRKAGLLDEGEVQTVEQMLKDLEERAINNLSRRDGHSSEPIGSIC